MEDMNRRKFLTLVGAGSGAVLAAAAISPTGILNWKAEGDSLTFRAVAGLPQAPLPAYASYVIEGTLSLGSRSGVITKSLYAGAPPAVSTVALPGFTRVVRITDVRVSRGQLRVSGIVDDRSQLQEGESATVAIRLDRSKGTAHADFLGTPVILRLVS